MSGDIYAFDPAVKPARRRVSGLFARVTPILYTSRKRCMGRPNPKRPAWMCKAAPVWMVQFPATLVDGQTVTPGGAFCDDCLSRLRRVPQINGVWSLKP
jgi:hypothetical protein